jgi:hypothetical protein
MAGLRLLAGLVCMLALLAAFFTFVGTHITTSIDGSEESLFRQRLLLGLSFLTIAAFLGWCSKW